MEIEGGKKNEPINCGEQQSIYVRTAFTLSHKSSSWDDENKFIQALNPVQRVRDLVNSVAFPHDVSVHIRMGEISDGKPPSYETDESNWSLDDQKLIDHWRSKSHYNNFVNRINMLTRENNSLSLFLACDNKIGYKALLDRYGSKINYLARPCFNRSTEQIQYALADALLLSKSRLILGSNWSSFTELASRLSTHNPKMEVAGIHF